MQEIETLTIRIDGILEDLRLYDGLPRPDEQTKDDIRALLADLLTYSGKVRDYYREKYELDRPNDKALELGRQAYELQQQGMKAKEICKMIKGLSMGNVYHRIAAYKHWLLDRGAVVKAAPGDIVPGRE